MQLNRFIIIANMGLYNVLPTVRYQRLYHSSFVRTLRNKKSERTLRTKKPKAHFYFSEIKYKVTIHNTHYTY